MKSEILQLLEQKVSQTVQLVDEATATEVREIWNTVNPSPACPSASDVMKQINKICHHGLTERGEKAREVSISTLRGFQKLLDEKLSNDVMRIMEKYFPEDQYITLAKNTKSVYERRQAPQQKFNEHVYDLEVAAISAGSANLSRRAIANIRSSVNELRLQTTAALPTIRERIKTFTLHYLILPAIKRLIVAVMSIILGIVLYYSGFLGIR
jgi:hypothetical protein